jgi:(p)ppGpp synthase/HD superfamily hydrolase
MKITQTEITKTPEGWKATITNGNGLKVHIEGCETKKIARRQADDRVIELKQAGLL